MKNILLFVAILLITVFYVLEMDLKAITTLNWIALGVASLTLVSLLIAIIVQNSKGKKAQKKLAESAAASSASQEPAEKK